VCPKDSTKAADLDRAVSSYVTWLADSYAAIKAKRPHATVLIGGVSSWQAQCWTQKLGQHGAYRYADAIAYHLMVRPRVRRSPRSMFSNRS
jgi:hypothetical protein